MSIGRGLAHCLCKRTPHSLDCPVWGEGEHGVALPPFDKAALELVPPKPKRLEYVVGFLFNERCTKVALIRKQKPDWQRGRLNGIGGSIEAGETAYEAMTREFQEETGVVMVSGWDQFLSLEAYNPGVSDQATIDFFMSFSDGALDQVTTTTDEKVYVVPVDELPLLKTVPNLAWIIPLALSMNEQRRLKIPVARFQMKEIGA